MNAVGISGTQSVRTVGSGRFNTEDEKIASMSPSMRQKDVRVIGSSDEAGFMNHLL